MNKVLKKAIMKRSKLWNTYRKTNSSSDLSAYKEQRNLVTKLNKQARKSHFNRAIDSAKSSPKVFWKICKPFMTNKSSITSGISIKHNSMFIEESDEIAEL